MFKFSKKALFVLILVNTICAGISFSNIDWENMENGNKIWDEIHLTVTFILLAFSFVFPYIKEIKKDNDKKT